MKQFIRYLYEYEQGRRIRNVGFVRVEQTEEETVVHIHGKGLRIAGTRRLTVYLFYETEDACVGILQGEIGNVNPAVNYQLRYTKEDTGKPENYPLIDGVILESEGQRRYAAVWDDMPVDINHMKVWEEKVETAVEETDHPGDLEQRLSEAERTEPAEAAESEEEAMEKMEESETSAVKGIGTDQGQEAGRRHACRVRKIQRKDLAQLPRCEWKLSNNSFLLHGYYNYRHLVLIEEEDIWKLGVPGIYHEKEANAAGAFGFGEFIPGKELEGITISEEWDDQDNFGYWCRPVRH